MRIKFNQDIWRLCPSYIGSLLLFCVLHPSPFRFFFQLFLFRTPVSWFSGRLFKVMTVQRLLKLLSGSFSTHIIVLVKADWKIVIKRKGVRGAFLWDDPDQDQWSEITWIMVDQMNRWIHSGQGFIGSFDLPWSRWSQIADPDPDHPKETHLKLWNFEFIFLRQISSR